MHLDHMSPVHILSFYPMVWLAEPKTDHLTKGLEFIELKRIQNQIEILHKQRKAWENFI